VIRGWGLVSQSEVIPTRFSTGKRVVHPQLLRWGQRGHLLSFDGERR